jgi:hypothetical protein
MQLDLLTVNGSENGSYVTTSMTRFGYFQASRVLKVPKFWKMKLIRSSGVTSKGGGGDSMWYAH